MKLLKRLNEMWPWSTPMDRAFARETWARRAAITRANRIRRRPEHDYRRQEGVVMMQHGFNADHCVCNGTHVRGVYCPRCPQPYWIAQQVTFL